ncbi:phage Gp37/Gp68 family protein [Paraburkholderia domus]|uniref:phage Gp37/Gp68 family protein n=1 Tax=Paraburkholderia domus TaxID=2793075 RepID=UPI001911802C|nr:phage Gp37/Gp68 family protein [Paraburkholderia domus]MBK5064846.1 phage Gp37/Gp68 family protein [Burkholderia sp. R-70199]CAE6967556.1 hypothetical protein R70199_07859 [Paraburkholderia domus]
MSENSKIEWTDHTFNTHWGCSKIGPGCDGCYAEELARRFGYGWGDETAKREFSEGHWQDLIRLDRKAASAGVRHRVFTNSMSDLFDKFAPAGVRERHWRYVALTPNLDHLLSTKRIGNVARMVPSAWLEPGGWPANVWLGATVVNQEEADRDISKLLAIPAAKHFLSMEPLLGPVSLRWLAAWPWNAPSTALNPAGVTNHLDGLRRLDWVIAGGESGRRARPMHPDWARALRDECAEAGVPFLFKQWGEWAPGENAPGPQSRTEQVAWRTFGDTWEYGSLTPKGSEGMHVDDAPAVWRVGKKAAGRLLDGITHDGFPS